MLSQITNNLPRYIGPTCHIIIFNFLFFFLSSSLHDTRICSRGQVRRGYRRAHVWPRPQPRQVWPRTLLCPVSAAATAVPTAMPSYGPSPGCGHHDIQPRPRTPSYPSSGMDAPTPSPGIGTKKTAVGVSPSLLGQMQLPLYLRGDRGDIGDKKRSARPCLDCEK